MPASFRFAMIGRRSEADAELDAHRTRLLEARDPAIIGTRGARVSRAGLGEVELRILIEDVEHGDVQRAVERVDRKSGVSGKSVSVRVDLGGRRNIKKKKHQKHD